MSAAELCVNDRCLRYAKLEAIQKGAGKLEVADVARALHAVNQGPSTIQSMVFEPKSLVLHLAYGGDKGATAKPLTRLELGPIFERK
jgi:hypothetical protein